MSRYVRAAAAILTATLITTAADAGPFRKVPGLHVSSVPAGYGHPRVPRVVRGFNPKQQVRSPKADVIILAPRR